MLYHVSLINSFLLYLLVLDRFLTIRYSHMVEEVINYSQLAFFIYSNLLTGLTNLLFWTYYEGVIFAMVILFVYFMIMLVLINNCRKCGFRAKL